MPVSQLLHPLRYLGLSPKSPVASLLLRKQKCIAPSMPKSCHIFDIEHKEVEEESHPLVPSASTTTTVDLSSILNAPAAFPAASAVQNVHPLECAWLTRSFTSDEFEKFLTQEQQLAATSSTTNNNNNNNTTSQMIQPKYEEEEMVDFDSFIYNSSAYLSLIASSSHNQQQPQQQQQQILSSPKQSSSSATSNNNNNNNNNSASKKRGRPAKPDPVSLVSRVSTSTSSTSAVASPSPSPSPSLYEVVSSTSGSASPKREGSPDLSDKYLKMRRSNNESSMKSRLRRKEKEAQNAELVERLSKENGLLRDQLTSLRAEFAQLKSVLEKHLQS